MKKFKTFREEAPVNAAGSGNVAGLGVGPQAEPGVHPKHGSSQHHRRKNNVLLTLLKRRMPGK
jgi:hypothetical protein